MSKKPKEAPEAAEDGEEGAKPKKGKKLIIIIVLLLLLLGGGGAGVYFSGILGEEKPAEEATTTEGEEGAEGEADNAAEGEKPTDEAPASTVLLQLPEFLVNLNTGGRGVSYLKMSVMLEIPNAEMQPRIEALQPKIMDILNTYLRELRASDLEGSAGIYRLREELLMRINKAVAPDKIHNVLFTSIQVQ